MTRPNTTKRRILDAAMIESKQRGYEHITREAIAQRAECAAGLVSFYFGTMIELRRAIMSEAVHTRNLRILAQGIVSKHPKAMRAPEDLRREALNSLMGV